MSRVDLAIQEMACPESVDDDDTLPNEVVMPVTETTLIIPNPSPVAWPSNTQALPQRFIPRYSAPAQYSMFSASPEINFVSKYDSVNRIYILNVDTGVEITRLIDNGKLIGFCPRGTGWLQFLYEDRLVYLNVYTREAVTTNRPDMNVDLYEGLFSGCPGLGGFTSVLVCVHFVPDGDRLEQNIDILVYNDGDWEFFIDTDDVFSGNMQLGMALDGNLLMVLDYSTFLHLMDINTFVIRKIEVFALQNIVFSESAIIWVNNNWYLVMMTDIGRRVFVIDAEQEQVTNVEFEDTITVACVNGSYGFGYYSPTADFLVARCDGTLEECRRYTGDNVFLVRVCVEDTEDNFHRRCHCRFGFYSS